MKKSKEVQLTVEDVNGNYLGQWEFKKMPKPFELIERKWEDIDTYYIIYNEEIELDKVLFVEELTESEFNNLKEKSTHK